jgi:hypothetical protein
VSEKAWLQLMDAFDEPYWNLCQVYVWALARDPKLVSLAGASELRKSDVEKLRSKITIEYYNKITGPKLEGATKRLDYFERHRNIPDMPSEEGQPVWPNNVLPFFRTGALKAWANVSGDPKAYEISQADWAGLEIVAPSGGFPELTVCRIGNRRLGAKGDFEDVRVDRESVLKVFPADPSEEARTGTKADSLPQQAIDTAITKPSKPQAAAEALLRLFGSARPALTQKQLAERLVAAAPELGFISLRTITRAIALAWGGSAPGRAK